MFKILYFFLWLITLLPLPVLYIFSDLSYYLVYYVVKYRHKVVRKNIRFSFPEKSEKELLKIEKKFYRHFCDIFIETICQINISETELRKRYLVKNPELVTKYYEQNRSVMMMTAHYGNWEWNSSLVFHLPADKTFYGIYKQLSNKKFNDMMLKVRSRFGSKVIEARDLYKTMLRMKNESVLGAFLMIGDQRPQGSSIRHWMTFLNQDTTVLTGTEQLAKKFNYPVLYMNIDRVKRGHYTCEFELITDNPKEMAANEISEKYMSILEKKLRKNPEYWLWSHNRWKHKRN